MVSKGEVASSEDSAKANGYAAAVYGMTSGIVSWPGIEDLEDRKIKPLELAQFLPDRIHRAFAAADPSVMDAGILGETNLNPPESDRPAFENAKQDATRVAAKLVEVALSDPDGILAPYLNGLPEAPLAAQSLITGRPYIYVAAGEKRRAKVNDAARFVLLYDDEPNRYGHYPCVLANGAGSAIGMEELKKQLKRRGKEKL